MAWNKDLAKLKQTLKSEENPEPKRTAPKVRSKPAAPRELEEEDALFLSAMGNRPRLTPSAEDVGTPPSPSPPPPTSLDFKEAMNALKGVKPVQGSPVPPKPARAAQAATPPDSQPQTKPSAELPPPETPIPPPKEEAPMAQGPSLIQLAAGMAIEVDGTLDLKGHSPQDAVERLKERILDGHLLGWRTLHVQLGPAEELRQAFLAFLSSPEAGLILRYAQAPIPMGGAQAWIIYLGLQGQGSPRERNDP